MLGILDYLHGSIPPILHRDIKPSNIIVRPDGTPALVDFGSARRVFLGPEEAGSTVAGTFGYMPYEQYMGQASPASDLYSLGATFLHLLTGRPPRDFMTDEGRIQVPDPLPGDPRLGAVISRLLRPSPAERFQSARDVRQVLLSPVPVAASSVARVLRGRAPVDVAALGPAPRALTGPAAELLDRCAPSAWDYMDSSSKRGEGVGFLDVLGLIVFSVLTAGTLPLIFLGVARARRRRLRLFLRHGLPAVAEVSSIHLEDLAFNEKLARVHYEFDADGVLHRDTDKVLPAIANRWRPGDQVQVLYLPDRDYDSVIISVG
jgi:hypothetical protein